MKTGIPFSRYTLLLLTALAGTSASMAQTTYHVASSGNDANSGSADAPFQSTGKVNSLSLRPGDQVLFRRGDTFRGTLQIRQSGSSAQPIVVDAYGSGSRPVLAGSVPVTGWSNVGNNVWQAGSAALGDQVTGVFRNGAVLPLGRYPNLDAPNRGYLTIQSHSGNAQFTSREGLPFAFVGGEAVERPAQWIINRSRITQQSGNTLTINDTDSYGLADNWGFFIQNHPATLDQEGEWYYNAANKTIQLYTGSDPNGQTITATAFSVGLSIASVSHVTVRNVVVAQSLNTGVLIDNGTNITLSGTDITGAGEDGLLLRGSGNTVVIENGLIEDVNNNGVSITGYQNVTFRGNTMRRVGMIPGRGKSGDGTYNGFVNNLTDNVVIENNVIDRIGYNGISFTSGTTVRRNRVSNFCLTKSDGGGLYIWNGNRQAMNNVRILSNIVFNGIGAPEGAPILYGGYSGANGIFLDDCTTNVEVRDNTVFSCNGLGFFLHGSIMAQFTGNTSFNNEEAQLAINSRNGGCSPAGNTVQNNVLVSRLATQLLTKYESHLNDIGNYGTFGNNVYARPFNDQFNMRVVSNPGSGVTGADLSLSEWQSRYNKDLDSRTSPLTYKPFSTVGNGVIKLNNTFGSNNEGWDTYSPYGNGRATQDNTNRLDGGSLSIGFPSASGRGDSYVLASKDIGSVSQNRAYLLTFDAVASGSNKRIEVFLRQKTGSYRDLDARSVMPVNGTRQRYELSFVANASEGSAIVVFQVKEDGQTLWVDNMQLQEATRSPQNPDDFIRLEYNDTNQDKTISLGTAYRDARNVLYTNQITLAPFTSAVLFRDNSTAPPPPTPVVLRDPENPANAVNGLDYGYYEGSWTSLPDFNALTPVRSGIATQADLTPRIADDNFALQFKGYVNVPTDGVYTFYTNSDDGSKLYIGTTEVVNNDGGHAEQERSGIIGLKAGRHALTISYFEGGGGELLGVSYSGPGLDKQVIPASALFRVGTNTPPPPPTPVTLRDPENPANAVSGLDYRYYEGNWSTLPNFGALTPTRTATATIPDLTLRGREDNFGFQFTGYVNVPTDGVYTFYTNSDDGSKLFIGTTEVVNNDGGHPEQERSGTIGLRAGRHAITVPYFEGGGGQALSVSYSGPGVGKQTIPASAFFRVGTGTPPPPPPVAGTGTGTGLRGEYFNNRTLTGPAVLTRTDAVIDFDWGTGSPAAGTVNVDNFSVRWTGQLEAPVSGNYTFTTIADDGIRLWVNGTQVINDWRDHAPTTTNSNAVVLTAGQKYDVRLEYYEGGIGAVARLRWTYPGQGQQVIPQQRLYPATGNARVSAASVAADDRTPLPSSVFPIPARDELTIRYTARQPGTATVQLVGLTGVPVFTSDHPVMAGENRIDVPVRALTRGFYVLKVNQGSERRTWKVLLSE